MPRPRKRTMTPEERKTVADLLRRRRAADRQRRSERRALVAAEAKSKGISDQAPPDWLQWRERLRKLDALWLRLDNATRRMREAAQAAPEVEQLQRGEGRWVSSSVFQKSAGRPRDARARALIVRARRIGIPGESGASFKAALAYHFLLAAGVLPEEAKARAMKPDLPDLDDQQRNRFALLERTAYR